MNRFNDIRKDDREKIERQVKEFLNKGNKTIEVATDESNDNSLSEIKKELIERLRAIDEQRASKAKNQKKNK